MKSKHYPDAQALIKTANHAFETVCLLYEKENGKALPSFIREAFKDSRFDNTAKLTVDQSIDRSHANCSRRQRQTKLSRPLSAWSRSRPSPQPENTTKIVREKMETAAN
jgi:hypothetical protein